jgi:hypothetical protein
MSGDELIIAISTITVFVAYLAYNYLAYTRPAQKAPPKLSEKSGREMEN